MGGFFRSVRRRASGGAARATITAVRHVAETAEDEPVLELDLAVARDRAEPYVVTVREAVPPARLWRARAGEDVRVTVDPADPERVRIDWDAAV